MYQTVWNTIFVSEKEGLSQYVLRLAELQLALKTSTKSKQSETDPVALYVQAANAKPYFDRVQCETACYALLLHVLHLLGHTFTTYCHHHHLTCSHMHHTDIDKHFTHARTHDIRL